MLADRLERLRGVRLLLGAERRVPPARVLPSPGQPRGERLQAALVHDALSSEEKGLRGDRDLTGFDRPSQAALARLIALLRSGKLEVRRYEKAFLHGKAFIFSDQDGVIEGSSNFTAAGLVSNRELNLGHYVPNLVDRVQEWFDRLWREAAPYDLAVLYEERFAEYDPYLIYLRVLWERYAGELEEEREPGSPIRLTTFQNDGAFRAALEEPREDPRKTSEALLAKVRECGLQPFQPPKPLPPIEDADISLVCRMGVEA